MHKAINWTIETYASVKTTQDIIKGFGALGKPEGVVVHAYEQTGGHGRHGRKWVSEKGNLYISILLRPPCSIEQLGEFGILAGVAVQQAVAESLGKNFPAEHIKLKWPNDVLINGKKCAGILVEYEKQKTGHTDFLAMGIGVNINHAPEATTAGLPTTYLNEYTKSPILIESMRDILLSRIQSLYELWSVHGFQGIKKIWHAHGPSKGSQIKIRLGNNIIEGQFYDLDDNGGLILQHHDFGLKTITAGELYS